MKQLISEMDDICNRRFQTLRFQKQTISEIYPLWNRQSWKLTIFFKQTETTSETHYFQCRCWLRQHVKSKSHYGGLQGQQEREPRQIRVYQRVRGHTQYTGTPEDPAGLTTDCNRCVSCIVSIRLQQNEHIQRQRLANVPENPPEISGQKVCLYFGMITSFVNNILLKAVQIIL